MIDRWNLLARLVVKQTPSIAHYSSCPLRWFTIAFQYTCTQMPKGIMFLWKDISLDCVLALLKEQDPEMVMLSLSHCSLMLKLSNNSKAFIKPNPPHI